MKFLLGKLLFLFTIIMGILIASGFDTWLVMNFLDLPTLAWFAFIMTAVVVATGEARTFVAAVNALLSKKYVMSAQDKERALRLFRLLGKTVLAAAVMLTAVGVTFMLYQLADPAALGPFLAISLLSVVYGVGINMVFIYPAINILETRYNTEERTVISERQVIDKLLELCYRQGVAPEDIINANEIAFK